MPRTIPSERPDCPPIRALAYDVLGLVKVVESREEGENKGSAKIVERWGEPDSSKCILAASILDREHDPLLGIARKSGSVELINAVNGNTYVHIPNTCQDATSPDDNSIVGLQFLRRQNESLSRSCTLLTCTMKGQSKMQTVEYDRSPEEFIPDPSPAEWSVCGSGSILFSKVDGNENHAVYGGKRVEINLWDLQTCAKIWTSKSPPKDNLGIFTPTWFTCATFLNKDDHRKFVAGTNFNQVRLYDISSQRRPVMSIDFRDTPIKAVTEDLDGHTIYAGNGSGDLASFDMRTGKLLGCFIGKCAGSIRSIARHPDLPVIASCGLDSYLRIWDIESRQLLSAVFLKQPLNGVVFDSHFRTEAVILPEPQDTNVIEATEQETLPAKKKKRRHDEGSEKVKKSKHRKRKSKHDSDEE